MQIKGDCEGNHLKVVLFVCYYVGTAQDCIHNSSNQLMNGFDSVSHLTHQW